MSRWKPWRGLSEAELTTAIAAAMIVGGVIVRVQGIGAPDFFAFDEQPFAENAFNYLAAAADYNDHPPLGKLLLAVGYLLFGYTSLAWRFVALCFGIHNLLIAYWLGSAVFESRRAGLFAAACLAADGFFIAYSRTGLLDGMLVCLVLWGVLAAVTARSRASVLASVLLLACATSIKWSGIMGVVPAAAAIWVYRRAPRSSLAAFALVLPLHAAIWMAGLALTGRPWDPVSLLSVMKTLFLDHLARGVEDHYAASPWYTWPLLYHPIILKLSAEGASDRYSSTIGNVVFYAAGTLTTVATPIAAGLLALRPRWRARAPEWLDRQFLERALLLVLGWVAMILPWMVARGKFTFIYHYLPSYGFALVLVAGVLAALERRYPRVVFVFFCAALLVAIYFVPVWGEFAIGSRTTRWRLIFESWKQ
jgi:dolichyl-phosphate-mannose--protein O-mannosyl transferase